MKEKITIETILIPMLFIGGFFDMPIGYYHLLRLLITFGLGWIAKIEIDNKRPITAILSIAIALLFNPFIKVTFEKEIWTVIDYCVAGVLFMGFLFDLIVVIKRKKKIEAAS